MKTIKDALTRDVQARKREKNIKQLPSIIRIQELTREIRQAVINSRK